MVFINLCDRYGSGNHVQFSLPKDTTPECKRGVSSRTPGTQRPPFNAVQPGPSMTMRTRNWKSASWNIGLSSRTDKQACMEGKVIEWTEGSGSVDRCEGGLNLDSNASRDPRTSANNKCIPTTIDNFSLQRPWSIFRAHKTAVPYVAGRADPTNVTDGEGRRECQFLFFRPACGIITRYHTSSPPHRRTSRVGRVCFLRGLINGGPRPLEYQPPGTTRTRRPRSFRGQWG